MGTHYLPIYTRCSPVRRSLQTTAETFVSTEKLFLFLFFFELPLCIRPLIYSPIISCSPRTEQFGEPCIRRIACTDLPCQTAIEPLSIPDRWRAQTLQVLANCNFGSLAGFVQLWLLLSEFTPSLLEFLPSQIVSYYSLEKFWLESVGNESPRTVLDTNLGSA